VSLDQAEPTESKCHLAPDLLTWLHKGERRASGEVIQRAGHTYHRWMCIRLIADLGVEMI